MMFVEAYPIEKKSNCADALKTFIRDYGAPDKMISDGAPEQIGQGTVFQAVLRKNQVVS